MQRLLWIATVLALPCGSWAQARVDVAAKGAVVRHAPLHLTLTASGLAPDQVAELWIDGRPARELQASDGTALTELRLRDGAQEIRVGDADLAAGAHTIEVRSGETRGALEVRPIAGWLTCVPPLVAIGLALVFKDVLIALFLGIFSGALILVGGNPLSAFGRSIDGFVAPALANGDHAKVIIFSMLLGGMVGLISKSGGTLGVVERMRRYATTPRRGQVATWAMGVFIFFDDYANSLIVGSTMRPITDQLRISREKLAYIVDSTAAPVASVFPISTWIGFEVGLIAAAFAALQLPYNPYLMFLGSIPFRFYPIFCLVFGFTIAFACRDFGPMLRAELRASHSGQLVAAGDTPLADYGASALAPPAGIPHRALNALLPILTVIGLTIVGLFVSGSSSVDRASQPSTGVWLREVFANAASLDVLLWSSLSAVVVAAALPLAQRVLSIRQAMEALLEGFKAMVLAMVVLVLAWSIGAVTGALHTADYVVAVTQSLLSPHWLPVLVFLVAAAISFATGTSWGTMAILMPLVVPTAHHLSLGAGHAVGSELYGTFMLGTISSVLAGSVWGDHCSPISDTTILSSMGSGCDHIAHVRTQLPYAVGVGVLGMLVGDIPTAFGLSPWISLLVGTAVIVAAVLLLGKKSAWDGTVATAVPLDAAEAAAVAGPGAKVDGPG